MKKDMGGAATALTLARLIMEAGLDVRLRVLIPIVENAISAPAMRPGDVIVSRKGLTVEIGNTDAEGRLILADALALADEEAPELMFDFATLTGAARVALGPDLPPFYTDDDALAAEIAGHAARRARSLWRMPLWRPYEAMIEGIGRRHQQFGHGRRLGGLDDRRAVPPAVRREGQVLGAFRHLRLESEAARPRARGRRDPGGAGVVRAACASATRGGEGGLASPPAPGAVALRRAHGVPDRPAGGDIMALTKHNRLTVGDLRKLKGKRRLTMLFVETPEEAAAAAAAEIDILSIVERPLWAPAMREAAGDCFVQVGLIYGDHCTYEDYLRAARRNS